MSIIGRGILAEKKLNIVMNILIQTFNSITVSLEDQSHIILNSAIIREIIARNR